MEKMTRAQINERLAKLRESKLSDDCYTYRPLLHSTAMCYCIAVPIYETKMKVCSICGQKFEIAYNPRKMEAAEDIVKQFRRIGMEAQLICNCPSCIVQRGATPHEIHIKTVDEQSWHISKPKELNEPESALRFAAEQIEYLHYLIISYRNSDSYTSDFEYKLVLKFLTVPEQIDDLAQLFDNLYNKDFRSQELDFESIDFYHEKKLAVVMALAQELDFESIDFYREKNLTVVHALKLIKEHMLEVIRKKLSDDSDLLEYEQDTMNIVYDRFMRLFGESYRVLTYKGVNSMAATYNSEETGFIKTQLDIALYKVLGLTIVYDTDEMKKHIESVLKNQDFVSHMQRDRHFDAYIVDDPLCEQSVAEYIRQAYNILEETGKKYFTICEYTDFMTELFQELQHPFAPAVQYLEDILRSVTSNTELRKVLLEAGQNWMHGLGKETFSKNELNQFVTQVAPELQHPFALAVQYLEDILHSVTYNTELRNFILKAGQAWMRALGKETFSKNELSRFLTQVLPQTELSSDKIKNIFYDEIKTNYHLCQYVRKYATQHGLSYVSSFEQVNITDFLRPLSGYKETVPFCDIYRLQEEISQLVSDFIGKEISITVVNRRCRI